MIKNEGEKNLVRISDKFTEPKVEVDQEILDELNKLSREDMYKELNHCIDLCLHSGFNPKYGYKSYAIELRSRLKHGGSVVFEYEEILAGNASIKERIIRELKRIGTYTPNDYERLVNLVEYLKQEDLFFEHESLAKFLPNAIKYELGIEYYLNLTHFINTNIKLFASEKLNNWDPEIHKGCILDSQSSIEKNGGILLAILPDLIKYAIKNVENNVISTNMKGAIKTDLINLGVLINRGEDGRVNRSFNGDKKKKFLLLKKIIHNKEINNTWGDVYERN